MVVKTKQSDSGLSLRHADFSRSGKNPLGGSLAISGEPRVPTEAPILIAGHHRLTPAQVAAHLSRRKELWEAKVGQVVQPLAAE